MGRKLLDHFLVLYTHKGFKPPNKYNFKIPLKESPDKIYGLSCHDLNEYRFHIGQFNHFEDYLQKTGYDRGFYIVDIGVIPEPFPITVKIKDEWKLRDRQPDVVDFLIQELADDLNSRLVTLPTGYGKGLIALWTICKRAYRTAIIIEPSFIDKFIFEIQNVTNLKEKDIMVVQGGDSLRGLIELGKTKTYKTEIVIISSKTWTNFITSYLENRNICINDEYGCAPENIYELLGIGTVLIDEIHRQFFGVYKTQCFMNVDLCIGLSATFLSRDPFIDKMQHIMFPREIRFEEVKMKKYIRTYGISYSISSQSLQLIRTSERGNTTYSQVAFERSILKHKKLTEKYMSLIEEVLINGFFDNFERGHKCIIYVRTIAMCEVITKFLKLIYPQYDIRKFTEQDPYENLIEPVIRVTTYQSGGTGHDLKGLMTIICLDNIDSPVANIQMLGRLREPPSGTARCFFVFSENIKKHYDYARKRHDLLLDRVASFKEFKSNVCL